MRSTTYLLAIASLLAIPMFAVAQKGPCGNGVSLCQIGPNQRCPIGCIKRANCPTTTRTSTVTSTITSTVSKTSITTRLSTSSFTSTITITATPTYAAAPDPSGTNPAVSAILPGACIFQQPYVNLFTFVDDNCGNGTIRDLQLDGFGNREVRNGLNQYPNKLQKVSTQSGYYGTACINIDLRYAQSMYWTVDALPLLAKNCRMVMFVESDCGTSIDTFALSTVNTCNPATVIAWRSARVECDGLL
ncbi:unnamed protein product [Zymoseptoria tritici ST99CH_1E4]|uniref:LysM domain-containing protein n=1 Tax=Zymoseptoria tritici ST99CH_1E4 TaxID=1276532 RepID=A0A2H1GBU2_ZYMTR|nr:unnamed protein product [Zymoseptoria tritici ST99CH_1E4]